MPAPATQAARDRATPLPPRQQRWLRRWTGIR
jgi:hypothetical protein